LAKIENVATKADETPQTAITIRNCGSVVLVDGEDEEIAVKKAMAKSVHDIMKRHAQYDSKVQIQEESAQNVKLQQSAQPTKPNLQ